MWLHTARRSVVLSRLCGGTLRTLIMELDRYILSRLCGGTLEEDFDYAFLTILSRLCGGTLIDFYYMTHMIF